MLPYLTHELDMLMVEREADGRTREDVLNRLLSHRIKKPLVLTYEDKMLVLDISVKDTNRLVHFYQQFM